MHHIYIYIHIYEPKCTYMQMCKNRDALYVIWVHGECVYLDVDKNINV